MNSTGPTFQGPSHVGPVEFTDNTVQEEVSWGRVGGAGRRCGFARGDRAWVVGGSGARGPHVAVGWLASGSAAGVGSNATTTFAASAGRPCVSRRLTVVG